MKKKFILALIAARSAALSAGLSALLKAIPKIDEVQTAAGIAAALQLIQDRKPDIVLIDSVLLGNNPERLLEKIALLSPKTRRVILTDDARAFQFMPRHAEAVLIKGVSPSSVATVVSDLLSTGGEQK